MTTLSTYEDFFHINSLSNIVPAEAINLLGGIFETARENKDLKLIEKGLDLSNTLNIDKATTLEKAIFYYNLANGWGYKLQLTTNPNEIGYNNKELINEIINIRLALSYNADHDNKFLKSQLYVNLGNIFSHLGRCSEAIILWRQALEYTPDFGMAIGNLGFGVFHYGKVVYDESQQIIFFQFAYNTLQEAIKSWNYLQNNAI